MHQPLVAGLVVDHVIDCQITITNDMLSWYIKYLLRRCKICQASATRLNHWFPFQWLRVSKTHSPSWPIELADPRWGSNTLFTLLRWAILFQRGYTPTMAAGTMLERERSQLSTVQVGMKVGTGSITVFYLSSQFTHSTKCAFNLYLTRQAKMEGNC